MKKDNVLKKEFKKKDVERMRNLVKGKTGAKTTQGVGYTKKYEHHKEGDVWEEDGRKWTIKNGIKQNITKMDKVKELGLIPTFCPSCNSLMKNLDKSIYTRHRHCHKCQADFETKLKLNGEWEDHQKSNYNKELDIFIQNYKDWMDDKLNESNENFVTEAGTVENWVGGIDKERALEEMEKTIEFLESLKKS